MISELSPDPLPEHLQVQKEAEKNLEFIVNGMKANNEYLHNKAPEVCGEIIELINDAIDHNREKAVGTADSAMRFFQLNILLPFSYAIHVDFIAGNIPTCYMQLRFILESLAKCFYADLNYPDEMVFQEKLELLHERERNITELMKKIDKKLEFEKGFATLWRDISNEWVHTKGFADRIMDQIVNKSNTPPWSLLIPLPYSDKDLETLEKFQNDIFRFRNLLEKVFSFGRNNS